MEHIVSARSILAKEQYGTVECVFNCTFTYTRI